MPFFNFSSGDFNFQSTDIDFCIIGAGAAGILMAVRLSEARKKVLVIETGHFFEDDSRQILNEVEQTGKILTSSTWGRKRAIGGTTIAWGGQSLPFSELDFEVRPWIKNSGWPITYKDLEYFYHKANAFMNIEQLDFCDEIFDLLKLKKQAFDPSKLYQHFSKWAPEPNFKIIGEKVLSEKIDLIYNANLTRISFINDGKEIEIDIKNFNGNKLILRVPKLILATGGIETNRILLSNRHQFENGIGNHSGWLGKCFMEHPCLTAGIIKNYASSYKLQRNFNTHIKKGIKYSVRLSLAKQAQINNKLLNASASLLFMLPDENLSPYNDIKSFLKTKEIKHFIKATRNIGSVIYSIDAFLRHNFIYKIKAIPHVTFMLEQEPLEKSFISLSNKVDMFGIHKAQINWSISKLTWETALALATYLQSETKRLKIGEMEISKELRADNIDWLAALSDVNHHMGGVRMSSSAGSGVVNSYGQVWGIDNLFICGSAIFPTSSFSNPTLTLLALCERLADKLTK